MLVEGRSLPEEAQDTKEDDTLLLGNTWPQNVKESSLEFLQSWNNYIGTFPHDVVDALNTKELVDDGELKREKRGAMARRNLRSTRKFFEEVAANMEADFGH